MTDEKRAELARDIDRVMFAPGRPYSDVLDAAVAVAERWIDKTEQRLLAISRGCHDYGGGYHDEREAEIYHHGIQTVANALAAAVENGTLQVRVLERVGLEGKT